MEYRYHYTMEYLPTRYEANSREWDNRHAVWNFKDGACSNSILNDMSETINDIVNGRESEYVSVSFRHQQSPKRSIGLRQ